jgi:predicted nucleotidyltransferase component of viral defense system
MADVLRFAGQSRVDVQVAVQEVVLTILRDRLAFKGGTALRKLVFGNAGRFSEDLDFVVVGGDDELAQLELEELLTADADEVSVRILGSEVAGPGTMT